MKVIKFCVLQLLELSSVLFSFFSSIMYEPKPSPVLPSPFPPTSLPFISFILLLKNPSSNPHPTLDHNPNTAPPQQHTTSLPRLSNGGSTAVETLWEWRGSQGATRVAWNPEGAEGRGLPDGMCSISRQPSLVMHRDGSMVLIILLTVLEHMQDYEERSRCGYVKW